MIRNVLLVAALLGTLASCDEMNMKIGPDTVFEEGDLLVVLGSIKKIKKCFKY